MSHTNKAAVPHMHSSSKGARLDVAAQAAAASCDGTKHHSSSKACGVRQWGTAVVIVGWHCTHATRRRHGRDSGGAVAAAWGARAIVRIGPQ